MILILSHKEFEQGTDPVIDWLLCKKARFTKLTIHDLLSDKITLSGNMNEGNLTLGMLDLNLINVIWLRRWHTRNLFKIDSDDANTLQAYRESSEEINKFSDYLFGILASKKWLSSPDAIRVNKLLNLLKASQTGIKVPQSRIVNNKKDLLLFCEEVSYQIICKPIEHSDYFIMGESTFSVYTSTLNKEAIHQLPDTFFPSLFQEKVDRMYEIRSFYLDGKFYSSVFLDMNNSQDDIDIKLNEDRKLVPYLLPNSIEKKLDNLMKEIGLNTGSLDIIRNNNGEYVFLEVNPVGQYAEPSHWANYHLEEKIADWLIAQDV